MKRNPLLNVSVLAFWKGPNLFSPRARTKPGCAAKA